jgi:outer membrane receptor for ferrienterochelin and colicin
MKKAARILIGALLVIGPTVQVWAQAIAPADLSDMTLEQLLDVHISVASTQGDDIFTTPSTVSVITAATLRRYNVESIAEALGMLPGVNVGRTFFRSNVVTLRGLLGDQYSNKVLILINGVPTWHATSGEGAYYRIAIQDVERIEVLRGPASVIYGTNAYAGVVNIVLRSSDQRQVQVDTGGGDQGGNAGVNMSLGGPGGATLLLSVHGGKATGDPWTFVDENKATGRIRDLHDDRMLTLSLQSSRHTVLVNLFRSRESFLGTRASFATGAGHDFVSNGTLVSYRYTRQLSPRVNLAAGAIYDGSQDDDPRSADNQVAGTTNGYRTSAFAKSSMTIGSHLSIDVGTDYDRRTSIDANNYRRDTGEVLYDNNLHNRSVREYSGSGEGTYRLRGRLRLNGGWRLTKNELFGANLSSRAAAIYTPRERQSLKLFWGQSFRAPSLYELYRRSQRGGLYGNEHLMPETSDTVEAAYVAAFRGVLLKGSAYHARYHNKITRVPRYPDFVSDPADNSATYGNRGHFSANGVELELTYDVPTIGNAFVNVGYVHGDRGDTPLDSNNYNFRYIPKASVTAGGSRQVHGISLAVVGRWVQSTNGFLAAVAGHTSFDVTLGYEQRAGAARLKHSLFAKDLLGRAAQTPEYLRGNINALPLGLGPRFGYRLQMSF